MSTAPHATTTPRATTAAHATTGRWDVLAALTPPASGSAKWGLRPLTLAALLFGALIVGAPSAALGQAGDVGPDDPDRWRAWLAIGAGSGGVEDGSGLAGIGQLVVGRGRHHLVLRGSGIVDPFGSSLDSVGDTGILYAWGTHPGWGHTLLGAGIGRAGGELCPFMNNDCDEGDRLSLPLLAEVAWEPASVFGLGVQLFGNLNRARHFAGLTVFVQLGWFR